MEPLFLPSSTKTDQDSQLVLDAWSHLPPEPLWDWSPALNPSKLARMLIVSWLLPAPFPGLAHDIPQLITNTPLCFTILGHRTCRTSAACSAPSNQVLLATDACMKQTELCHMPPLHPEQDIIKLLCLPIRKCHIYIQSVYPWPGGCKSLSPLKTFPLFLVLSFRMPFSEGKMECKGQKLLCSWKISNLNALGLKYI